MKFILLSTFFFSTNIYAQNMDVNGLKNLFTQKKAVLESINVGMSKKVTTVATDEFDGGSCTYTRTALQTVLKVEGDNIIVYSKESIQPEQTEACTEAGYEAFEEDMIFYEEVPKLSSDLEDLDATAKDITSITRAGDLITMKVKDAESSDVFTLKYDLTKSSFKNLISTVGTGFSTTVQDMSDVNVNSIDLTNILFCETSESETSSCVEGDFSDILF